MEGMLTKLVTANADDLLLDTEAWRRKPRLSVGRLPISHARLSLIFDCHDDAILLYTPIHMLEIV
jgi:hypothetical protein